MTTVEYSLNCTATVNLVGLDFLYFLWRVLTVYNRAWICCWHNILLEVSNTGFFPQHGGFVVAIISPKANEWNRGPVVSSPRKRITRFVGVCLLCSTKAKIFRGALVSVRRTLRFMLGLFYLDLLTLSTSFFCKRSMSMLCRYISDVVSPCRILWSRS